MTDHHNAAASEPAPAQRQAWTTPRLVRLSAGDAELGANPANPELAFAYGS